MILQHPDPYVRSLIQQGNEDSLHLGLDNECNFEHNASQPRPCVNSNDIDKILGIRLLARTRLHTWPFASDEFAGHPAARIYSLVRKYGTSNETGAKEPVPTRLDIQKWTSLATGHSDDTIVLNGIKYGFSVQYTGSPLQELPIEMHASGEKFKSHIKAYIHEEIKYKAIAGPFKKPPFDGWCRTSPLMTRPKSNSLKRRVIVDLSFPPESNVNSGVYKNNY